MFKKKYFLIMLILLISICAISSASAADGATDTIASDDATVLDADMSVTNDEPTAVTNDQSTEDTKDIGDAKSLTPSEDEKKEEKKLSDSQLIEEADESGSYSLLHYYDYDVNITSVNEISSKDGGNVYLYIDPCKDRSYYAFDFYICVYKNVKNNVFDNLIYRSDRFKSGSSSDRTADLYKYHFDGGLFTTGSYYITVENYLDDKIMTYGVVKVPGNAVISAGNFSKYYKSNSTMTVSITDKATGLGVPNSNLKLVFTKGKTKIVKEYITTKSGYLRYKPPLTAGTWTVTISSNYDHIKASSIKRTIVIKKPTVSISAKQFTDYLTYQSTLKATVKALGKNVNEGTVTFKINGKSYKVSVKNGVATKKIKLSKAKTYSYTATYSGANYIGKSSKSKVVVKKQIATKIVVGNQKVYSYDIKPVTIKIQTTGGKKVPNGKIKLGDGTVAEVENGQVRVLKYGLTSKHFKGGSSLYKYYRKSITKTSTLKYIPTDHKYKASTKKIKITSVFKCNICGKTGTHAHKYSGYSIRIIVS